MLLTPAWSGRVAWALVVCQWTVNLALAWSVPVQLVRGTFGLAGLLFCFTGSSLLLACFAHPRLARHRLPFALSALSLLISWPSVYPLSLVGLVHNPPIVHCKQGGWSSLGCTDYHK